MKPYILLLIFLLGACSIIERDLSANEFYKPVNIAIPIADLENLQVAKELSSEEIDQVINKYSVNDDQLEAIISKETGNLPGHNYLVCGGVYWESSNLSQNSIKFKVTGVTDKWIPIEGKVKRVLHFRMSE